MSYKPQPGTMPHRVIEYLKSQPAGTEFSSHALAAAVGHEGSAIASYLVAAVEHGAIVCEKRMPMLGTRLVAYYRLGENAPPEKPDDSVQVAPEQKPAKASNPCKDAPSATAIFGHFSDGRISIETGGKCIELREKDAADLVAFIQRTFA